MGAYCCVAARDKIVPQQIGRSVTRTNARYSPSWSFRWDNRTHIEDNVAACSSYYNSESIGFENKSGTDVETDGFSDCGSPLDRIVEAKWRKPFVTTEADILELISAENQPSQCGSSLEKRSRKFPVMEHVLDARVIPSTPSPPTFITDPSSSRSRSLPSNATPSGKVFYSRNSELARQVSDSGVDALESDDGNNPSEERQPFVLSFCGNDLSTGGSYASGSSDGWSMRTFSELVASSQRERWSLDSENRSSMSRKITSSDTPQQSTTPASDNVPTCGLCSTLLKERPSWCLQNAVAGNELAVVAILACGHVYHAECLEIAAAPEVDVCDPSCPVCDNGGLAFPKLLWEAELKAKNKLTETGNSSGSISERRKKGKLPRIGASSSMRSTLSKPFLWRNFSVGPRNPSGCRPES